jgi:hypothetical protein
MPDYEDVEHLLRRQVEAIREACPLRRPPRGAAYRESLLLRLRLDWSGGFDGVELRCREAGRSVALNLSLLESLTAWFAEERDMPLVEGGTSLGHLWELVREIVLSLPARQVSVDRLASLVPVRRDLWDQWISRGRRMVQRRLGADYSNVFPLWHGEGGDA